MLELFLCNATKFLETSVFIKVSGACYSSDHFCGMCIVLSTNAPMNMFGLRSL